MRILLRYVTYVRETAWKMLTIDNYWITSVYLQSVNLILILTIKFCIILILANSTLSFSQKYRTRQSVLVKISLWLQHFQRSTRNQRFKTISKNGTKYGKHRKEILRNNVIFLVYDSKLSTVIIHNIQNYVIRIENARVPFLQSYGGKCAAIIRDTGEQTKAGWLAVATMVASVPLLWMG